MKSFTERVRYEIAENLPSPQCCRRSMLCGMLINADCSPTGGVYAKLSGNASIELLPKILRETYGREAIVNLQKNYGRVAAEVAFTSEKLADKLRELSGESESTLFKCKDCSSAFLAGILLSSANFSNPDKEYWTPLGMWLTQDALQKSKSSKRENISLTDLLKVAK